MRSRLFIIFVSLASTLGCDSSSTGGLDTAASSATFPGPAELDYCPGAKSYLDTITVQGNAQYIRREVFGDSFEGGLGSANPNDPAHPASQHPIRYAEVRVSDASGTLIQCGETDAIGNFSLKLPRGTGAYTLAVNSRSNNHHLFASILDQPISNRFYSLSTSVDSEFSTRLQPLVAQANGDVLGGAFNILDQLLNANLYLVAKVSHCSDKFQLCSNYDPSLHKISAYWQRGFNPNVYFGNATSGLSFYLPGYSRLFILGGINGDTDHSDTDHFDNSVIIHEYGHFLEETWLKSDSPGGAHDGDELLDPRLAWSEGWGDFIQAAVRGDSHYIDTLGNVDGSTRMAFNVDTETASLGSDLPENEGEGSFREFAVTRLLWDAIDDTPNEIGYSYTDDVSGKFDEIWAALTKTQFGYRDPSFAFRNVSLMLASQHYLHAHPLANNAPASNWANIRRLNRQPADSAHYAQYIVPNNSGRCTTAPKFMPRLAPQSAFYFQMSPIAIPGDSGSLSSSNLFQNNRFFHLHVDPSQAGNHSLQLIYQDDDGNSSVADLDLYLYNSKARFAVASDMVGFSRTSPSGTAPETIPQREVIQTDLASGDYLINVNVYTGRNVGSTSDFNLVWDGVPLCPANLVPR